ncbi:hypothetical protein [Nocardioides mangrovi]|uniref:Uncharacterized protein n=1 Tax=Nocardioides mangrovi TaxID=2874580 RepID=A0ABS7UJF8_9ACTN|nr:hypothetical protein [Nocardioides mangrovi]MBZ5740773.1 hypothetical protein [Nocardioides mangrovi]
MGAALVLAPTRVLRLVGAADASDLVVRAIARALGARYLAQGTAGAPSGRTAAAVESIHAASMLPIGAWSSRHRRAALTSAGVATLIAAADLVEGHR